MWLAEEEEMKTEIMDKPGQSMLEYTLFLAVVIAIIITFTVTKGGLFRTNVEKAYNKSADALGKAADNITNQVFN